LRKERELPRVGAQAAPEDGRKNTDTSLTVKAPLVPVYQGPPKAPGRGHELTRPGSGRGPLGGVGSQKKKKRHMRKGKMSACGKQGDTRNKARSGRG